MVRIGVVSVRVMRMASGVSRDGEDVVVPVRVMRVVVVSARVMKMVVMSVVVSVRLMRMIAVSVRVQTAVVYVRVMMI